MPNQEWMDKLNASLPEGFRMAEGRYYSYVCTYCGDPIGGGIENEKHKAGTYRKTNEPCPWCDKKAVVIVYEDEDAET